MHIAELKDKYRKTLSLEKAHIGWKDEYEVSSKQVSYMYIFIYEKCCSRFYYSFHHIKPNLNSKIIRIFDWEGGSEESLFVCLAQCMHGPNCKLGSFCTVGKRIQEVNVLGGLILPIWGTIEKALSKQVSSYTIMI